MPQDRLDAARPFNPHIRLGRSDQRGYMAFHLDAKRLAARVMAVDDARDPHSAVRVSARFEVDPARPGAEPA